MEQYDVRWFEEPVVPEDLEVIAVLNQWWWFSTPGAYSWFEFYHHQPSLILCLRVTSECKQRQRFPSLGGSVASWGGQLWWSSWSSSWWSWCPLLRYGFRDLIASPGGPCVSIAQVWNYILVTNDCICSSSNYNQILSQPDIAASGGLSEFLKISAIASTFGVGWQRLVGITMNTLIKMTTEEHNHIKLIALTTMTKLIPRWTLFRMFGAPQLVWRQVSMPWW